MNLHEWALKWSIPFDAFRDLQTALGTYTPPLPQSVERVSPKSEAFVQSVVRLEASEKRAYLFRNNVGALKDTTGRVVRYGLANDTPAMNAAIKSADLIGWRPLVIQPHHVGFTIAQFLSRECKPEGWQYTGTEREPAQLAWINLVNAHGGDAAFATGKGSL